MVQADAVNWDNYRATVSKPEIVELLKLSAAATPGPWKASDRVGDAWYVMGPDLVDKRQNIMVALWPIHPAEETKAAEIVTEANAQFTAALVNWFRSHASALQQIANMLASSPESPAKEQPGEQNEPSAYLNSKQIAEGEARIATPDAAAMSETPQTDGLAVRHEQENKDYHYRWHDYDRLARQLERELSQAQARCAELEKFRKFVGLLLFDYCENWGTDIGGDMIEEYLLKSGLAAREMVTEPCGEYCQCADINDFPLECNRLSKEAMLAKHDLPATLSEPDQEPDDSSSKG